MKLNGLILTHPLTNRAPLRAWVRFLQWQVVSRLRKEVNIPWVAGQRLVVRRGMSGASGNIYFGLHEFSDMMLALHFLREGDLFLDIGANIGSYTILSSGVCGATSWSFEPDPDTAKALITNIAVNNLDGRTKVFKCALGDARGEVHFTLGLDCVNQVVKDQNTASRIVPQEALDNILLDALPIMAKIDVEGYEEPVIKGASKLLSSPDFRVLEIETMTPWIESALREHGFNRRYYDPFSRKLTSEANGLKSNNAVFVKDESFVAERLAEAPKFNIMGLAI